MLILSSLPVTVPFCLQYEFDLCHHACHFFPVALVPSHVQCYVSSVLLRGVALFSFQGCVFFAPVLWGKPATLQGPLVWPFLLFWKWTFLFLNTLVPSSWIRQPMLVNEGDTSLLWSSTCFLVWFVFPCSVQNQSSGWSVADPGWPPDPIYICGSKEIDLRWIKKGWETSYVASFSILQMRKLRP